jgi:hypothetical protein
MSITTYGDKTFSPVWIPPHFAGGSPDMYQGFLPPGILVEMRLPSQEQTFGQDMVEHDITQEELVVDLGVSESLVNQWLDKNQSQNFGSPLWTDGPDIVLTAFPGDWDIGIQRCQANRPDEWVGFDADKITELMKAVDEENDNRILAEITQVEAELEWVNLDNTFIDHPFHNCPSQYFHLDEDRKRYQRNFYGHIIQKPRISFQIEETLSQFEEDWDYEQTLAEEKKKNNEVNLHRLLACWDMARRPGWCGSGQSERYKWLVEIVHNHPTDRVRGYAVGKTDYGLIYFPEKFRKYLPPVGSTVTTTVALQDVGSAQKKGNSFRFTAIFTHK